MRTEYGTITDEERVVREAQGRPAPNLQLAMAVLPEAATHQWRLLKTVVAALPADICELAIMAVAAHVGNGYCWGHHVPLMLDLGYTPTQLIALREGRVNGFSERDQAVIAYAVAVETMQVDDEMFATTNALLSHLEIESITLLVGCYGLVSRVQAAFDVPQDEGFGGLESPG